jgi:hypothetical protein
MGPVCQTNKKEKRYLLPPHAIDVFVCPTGKPAMAAGGHASSARSSTAPTTDLRAPTHAVARSTPHVSSPAPLFLCKFAAAPREDNRRRITKVYRAATTRCSWTWPQRRRSGSDRAHGWAVLGDAAEQDARGQRLRTSSRTASAQGGRV